MSRARWAATVALLPTVALVACEESAVSPADESLIPPASAQVASPTSEAPRIPGPRGPAEILSLADELALTDAQRAPVEKVAAELRSLNEPLWEEVRGHAGPPGGTGAGGAPSGGPPAGGPPSLNPGPLGSADDPVIREIRENTRQAMDEALSHLSEGQVRLFFELRQERLKAPAPLGAGPAGYLDPTGSLHALLEELELTESQRSRLGSVLQEVEEKRRAVLDELRLRAGAEWGGGPDRVGGWDPDDPRVGQLRETLHTGMAVVRGILTPDQWDELQALLRERRGSLPTLGSP